MKDPKNTSGNVHELIAEAKNILQSDDNPNQKMENLNAIVSQVDFLLERYDQLYGAFANVFTSMVQMDFSQRVPKEYEREEFIEFFVKGVNMVNEELEQVAVHKHIIHTMLDGLDIKGATILLTNNKGRITFVHQGHNDLSDFDEVALKGQYIHVIFNNFDLIDRKIKELGSVKDIMIELKWKGNIFPVKLTLAIAVKLGQINSLVYILKK